MDVGDGIGSGSWAGLERLCAGAMQLLGATSVALLLAPDGGELRPGPATGRPLAAELLRHLEAGPWRERRCSSMSRPLVIADVRVPGPWPALRRSAADSGFLSLAIALLPGGGGGQDCGGLLAAGSAAAGGLSTHAQRTTLQGLAGVAGACSRMALQTRRARNLAQHLQHALFTRVVVEQGKGFLAARLGLPPDEAFEILRRYARPRNETVRDVSRALLDGALDPAAVVRDSHPRALAQPRHHRAHRP